MDIRLAATLLVFLAAAGAVYWFMVRPILAQREQFRDFYRALDAVEATWMFKVQMTFKGFKNKIWAWVLIIGPGAVTALQMIGTIDPTIVAPFLPEKYQALLPGIFMVIGVVNLQLRKFTTTPEGSPVPTDAPAVVEVPTVAGKPDVEITVEPSPAPDKAVEVAAVTPISAAGA